MGDITVRHSRAVQVDITHAMIVASVDGAAHVPAVQRVKAEIKRHGEVGTPVTVDVLRFRYASTGGFVIGHDITDGVFGNLPSAIRGETPVSLILGHGESHTVGHEFLLSLHLEVETEVRVERWLQTSVTSRDVQRVRIVIDLEQLGDLWLLRLSAELNLEVGLLVETVTHIQCGRDIGDGSDGIHWHSQILLDEVRLLRLDVDTDIHIQFFAHHAELYVDVLVMLRSLGETAQVGREITLIGIVEVAEQASPLAVFVEHLCEGLVGIDGGEVVGRGIALLMAVVIAVVQLQEDTLCTERAHAVAVAEGSALLRLCGVDLHGFRFEIQDRLGIGETYLIAEVIGGRHRVAIGLIGGVIAEDVFLLEEVHGRKIGVLVRAITVVDISADGNISSFRSDAAVELQLCTGILVGAVAERLALTVVDHESLFVQK